MIPFLFYLILPYAVTKLSSQGLSTAFESLQDLSDAPASPEETQLIRYFHVDLFTILTTSPSSLHQLTYLFTPAPLLPSAELLPHSLTHSITHSLTYTHKLPYLLTPTHSITHSLTCLLRHQGKLSPRTWYLECRKSTCPQIRVRK